MSTTARKAAKSAAAVLVGAGVGAAGVAVVSSNLAHAGDTAPAAQTVQQPAAPGAASQQQGSLPQGVVPQQGAQDPAQQQSAQDPAQQQGQQGMVAPGQGGPQGATHGS